MPIYWRNKRYTEDEREKLWIHKLDQNTRYVCGEKVKADNEEEYQKLLKFYRRRNTELGYGNPEDWDAQKYEHERRLLKQAKRINTATALAVRAPSGRAFQENSFTALSRTSAQDERGAEPTNKSVINGEQPVSRREAISVTESRTIDWEKEIPF